MTRDDELWIPLVDEPIGTFVSEIQSEQADIASAVESPRRLLAFRTFAYLRVGMLLGRLLNAWFGDPTFAYVGLAMLFSAATTFIVFWLGRRLYDRATATAAATLLAVSPLFWFYASSSSRSATSLAATSARTAQHDVVAGDLVAAVRLDVL